MESLGCAHINFGEYQQATGLLERAMDIKKRELGPKHIDFFHTYALLATALNGLGKHQRQRT